MAESSSEASEHTARPEQPHAKPNEPFAITSMVLGIVAVSTVVFTFGLPAIVGIVLGLVSLRRIAASDRRLGGKGYAVTGIVTSAAAVVLAAAALVVYLLIARKL